jgi:hypothetical protein
VHARQLVSRTLAYCFVVQGTSVKHLRAFAAFDLAWALINSASGVVVALFRLSVSFAANLYAFQRLDGPLFGENVATTALDRSVARGVLSWRQRISSSAAYGGGVELSSDDDARKPARMRVAETFRDVTGTAHLDMGHAAYVGGACTCAATTVCSMR